MTTAERDVWDADPVDDGPGAEVVQLHKTPPTVEPAAPSAARQALARLTDRPLPDRRQIAVTTGWYGMRLAKLAPRLPWLLLRELRPVARGVGKLAVGWASWVNATTDRADAAHAEGNLRAKQALAASKKARANAVITLILGAAWSAGWVWLWAVHLHWAVIATVAVVGVLDLIGRAGRDAAPFLPPSAMPAVLSANIPLGQITESILAAFAREGFEDGSVGVAVPLAWDHNRSEYRISLAVRDGITTEHLRAVERAIGAKDHSIRSLATDTATVRQLAIRIGDPLAALAERPWVPTGTRSVTQGIDLGDSMTEVPFLIPVAGAHIRIVAATGGGKTKWILRSVIDGLSACRDCVIAGIDITRGPELTMWRDVIQHRGFNVEDAEKVLDLALAEIERRGQILSDIAEDDDPDNDVDEWHAGLGPAFVILADEFSQLAEHNGKGGKANLLGKCEQIVRTGRKHWVSLIMLTQRTGNDDFGSTTMSTQCAVTIAGPCDPQDAVRMFGIERRDGGYTPHLLSPGVEGDIRDAGKVLIESPMHRTPDIYRAYAPGTNAEVKRRARQRILDGLPTLDGRRRDAVDAVEVPPIPAAVARAFADCDADRLPTTVLIAYLAAAGITVTDQTLSDAMKIGDERIGDRWRETPGAVSQVRGYTRAAVERHIRSLG